MEPVVGEPDALVAPGRRLPAPRSARNQREQALPVCAESKEVIALFRADQVERRMLDAMAVDDLGRLLELFTARAIQTLVIGDVQVVWALLLDALQQGDDAAHVARRGRPDPVVVAAFEPAPVVGEGRGHAVHPLARPPRDAGARGRLDHRLAVLVHPHEKVHLIAPQPVIARDAIGADFLQGVTQVGIAVGVIDGCGEIELRHYNRSCSTATTRVAPSSARSVTRSRKMSMETTRSSPTEVLTVLPSFGKRLRCCT